MLRFTDLSAPGITRKRTGRAWAYFAPDGARITDRGEIDRLNAVGLPPAYEQAWFCPHGDCHIQAVGTDARGRRQYRYHGEFRAQREADKYEGCMEFGQALPKLRRRVDLDLKRKALDKQRVVAAVVRLLDEEKIRIGNRQYARDNKSYGATTIMSRHIKRQGGRLMMRFTGKHGIVHEVPLSDSRLARVVKRCQELPGQMLFQYVNGDGEPQPVTSADVNDYMREASGADFTAKHFRTWGASVIAFEQLLTKRENARITVKTVVEPVAEALGNTPAISRKSYVHPALLEAVKSDPRDPLEGIEQPPPRKRLSRAEVGLLEFLAQGTSRRRKVKQAAA
ncbi:MAG TPA: DNA topoisomerase IB [Sphingomicrobium sp.]|nr:DNA topoisomerase IB [Sphingomicrobium sp.]